MMRVRFFPLDSLFLFVLVWVLFVYPRPTRATVLPQPAEQWSQPLYFNITGVRFQRPTFASSVSCSQANRRIYLAFRRFEAFLKETCDIYSSDLQQKNVGFKRESTDSAKEQEEEEEENLLKGRKDVQELYDLDRNNNTSRKHHQTRPDSERSSWIRISLSIDLCDVVVEDRMSPVSEAYTLDIQPTQIRIQSTSYLGSLHAFSTLQQLLVGPAPGQKGPCQMQIQRIKDEPRFGYRGFMLDTSRNYFPVEDLQRLLDGMSYAKLNVFHWHMLDSQSFPLLWDYDDYKLPLYGAYRFSNGSMKVYSRQEVHDLILYAADRGILVVPEFESPGHATVWGNAYPEMLSCANSTRFCAQPPCGQFNPTVERTYHVFGAFLKAMTTWFPSPFWHLGFDEVVAPCWGKIDLHAVIQSFFGRIHQIMEPLHKQRLYWDEVLTDYRLKLNRNDTIIQAWHTGAAKSATSQGYRTVVSTSDYLYFDCGPHVKWCSPYKTWETVYGYDPTHDLTEEEASLVLGATACLWTETIKRDILDQAIWPRLLAAAEKWWSPKSVTSHFQNETMLERLAYHQRVLRSRFHIDSAPIDFDGSYPQLYRPEWCDFNLGSPAAYGNPIYVPGNATHDYCTPAYFYDTNAIRRPL